MKSLKVIGILFSTLCVASIAAASAIPFQDAVPAAAKKGVVGNVSGKIVFEGDKPEPKALTITDKQSEGCCPAGVSMDTTDRSLLLSEDGGIANVVVTIEVKGEKPEVPSEPLHLDQSKCRFEPHVVVIPVGASIAYLNSDEVSHNIHTYATKNEGLNKTVSAGTDLTQKFDKAEQVKVTCDIHPWMSSWIVVTDATVWDVSGEDGTFEISGLDAGEYELEVWHETLGKEKADVVIKADGTSEPVEVKLGDSKKKKGRRR